MIPDLKFSRLLDVHLSFTGGPGHLGAGVSKMLARKMTSMTSCSPFDRASGVRLSYEYHCSHVAAPPAYGKPTVSDGPQGSPSTIWVSSIRALQLTINSQAPCTHSRDLEVQSRRIHSIMYCVFYTGCSRALKETQGQRRHALNADQNRFMLCHSCSDQCILT